MVKFVEKWSKLNILRLLSGSKVKDEIVIYGAPTENYSLE